MTESPLPKPRHYTDVQMHVMCAASLLAFLVGFGAVAMLIIPDTGNTEGPVGTLGLPMTWGVLVVGWILFANRKPGAGIVLCLAAPILWAAMALTVV